MKFLFVHPSVELYGADKILLYILEILAKENHELTVLLPKEGVIVEYIRKISSSIKIVVDNNLPIAHSRLGLMDYFSLSMKIREIGSLFP
jgi:hypothetical protein